MSRHKAKNIDNPAEDKSDSDAGKVSRLRAFESVATFGLLLLAIGLVAPFTSLDNKVMLEVFKWIYTAGAALYLIARICGGHDPSDSLRVRRMRRLEVWAGVAFAIAAFFWFYNGQRYAGFPMTLGMLRDTVVFTLAGAVIQIVSAWLIMARKRKDDAAKDNKPV